MGTERIVAMADRAAKGETLRLTVAGFMGSAAVQCPCGARNAVMVPFIIGLSPQSECVECGSRFRIAAMEFDETKPLEEQFSIRVVGKPPAVIRPGR